MFGNALHVSFGGRGRGFDENVLRWTRGAVARLIAEAAWAAVVAALFFWWLMSSQASDPLSGGRPDCVSFGRGGARCNEAAPEAKGAATLSARNSECVSLGRGGKVCSARSPTAQP